MYLIERIIGILTYIICLLIFALIIVKKESNTKTILKIYVLVLSIIAFFYIPPTGEDLYRISNMMDSFKNINLIDLIGILSKTSYPLGMLIYFFVAKTGIYGILPAIAVFFTYSNIFKILLDSFEKSKLSKKNISWMLLITMCNGMYGILISNIRSLWSLSIVAMCIYMEIVCHKSIISSLLLYIIAFLIHPVSILIVAIRIIYYILFELKNKKIIKIITALLIFLISIILKKYLVMAIDKFNNYSTNGNYFSKFEFIKLIIMDSFVLYIIFLYKRSLFIKSEYKKMYKLLLIIFAVLVFLNEFNIFMRCSYFCFILFLPLINEIINNSKSLKNKRNFQYITLTNVFLLLTISCTRCHLSSLKFFIINR